MTLPVRTLEESARPLSQRILDVLRKDPENGYTVLDLFTKIEGTAPSAMALLFLAMPPAERTRIFLPYRDAIAELERAQAVRRFVHSGLEYYAAVRA